MAAPPEVDVHHMNASYDMNKKLSDSTTSMLKMQGLPWLVRQAAAYSAVQVNLKQYTDHEGPHLDQEQISTGNITQQELRLLNGELGERDIQFWGKVNGKNRYIKISDIEDPFLKEGWLEEGEGEEKGDVIESWTESLENGWTALQIWGFQMVDGQRKHVRRIVSKKGKEEHKVKLIYDFKVQQ
ncbi:hypothetical protein DOTSEDRAFT_71989 [Lecanosticta acicola]|uniref:LCCL domain-containing protein n=1 Tax=Lecanosticta acicola TaxID=111012 RepID=A0AAI9ECA2_9PEZI|nr:hypothetical protein DOTSEDRAFT_71989 [Lecanosticta acicola]